ncbi:FAD-dependent monooxygenase terD [Colletotrichum gloeosporioides]|uniref:FAD-dependent monooxygenase terD n=1 Tax=Colletotrichum gloeosporioides TaxID=474922 RepID=A0A8H4CQ85_COLGL|nr:FAD-dependent monooxygenase terD [Colletotrichum gloeosporioides]KAF3807886.1 FAD-dependent monooxygenase terD [Colletotrichum gloeosporioides]
MPDEEVDVLICGSGSAGLCAAVWLARCGVKFKILERREGPLQQGQADGVQCRTVEIMESLGLSEDLLKEAYHVLELAFWTPDGNGGIRRSHLEPDTEPGLNIKRVSGQSHIQYGSDVQSVEVDSQLASDRKAHCVTVKAVENGVERTYRAKYALGCDGAHSSVRKSLGFKMVGDSTDAVWAVMDVFAKTDFPDIRKKCVLQSPAGNLVIIPREGDEKVRFYMEMPGWAASDVKPDKVKHRVDQIFSPYTVDIVETSWFSAYSIGQRLADNFTKDHRVFLTGDACHTHSPKAGQGMNVSLQDGYNIGWKLAAVIKMENDPAILETYVSERQETANDLIEFDRHFTNLFSSSYRKEHGVTAEDFQDYFIKSGRYTAGLAIEYKPSILIRPSEADKLASGVRVGMRFPSAQVVRVFDARVTQLARALQSDSRWHVVVFGGDINNAEAEARLSQAISGLAAALGTLVSKDFNVHSRFHPILLLKSDRKVLDERKIPSFFTPSTGHRGVRKGVPCLDVQDIFVDDHSYHAGHGEAYAKYGVDPAVGAVTLVRPDQYVSLICPLGRPNDIVKFFMDPTVPSKD